MTDTYERVRVYLTRLHAAWMLTDGTLEEAPVGVPALGIAKQTDEIATRLDALRTGLEDALAGETVLPVAEWLRVSVQAEIDTISAEVAHLVLTRDAAEADEGERGMGWWVAAMRLALTTHYAGQIALLGEMVGADAYSRLADLLPEPEAGD